MSKIVILCINTCFSSGIHQEKGHLPILERHEMYISSYDYLFTNMSEYAVTLQPYRINGETIYTNFKPPPKNAFGMPKARKPTSSIPLQRDANFQAYMDTGVLIGDVKTITGEMKAKDKRIFQKKFTCKHICDAHTEDTKSYGIDWKGLNPANDYVFACDKHCHSMHAAECDTLMFSCHSSCPFTRFEENISLTLPWTNPVLFHSRGSDSNMRISISDHTNTTWHRFWRAVHLNSWEEYTVLETDRFKIKNSFARLRYVCAINAVLNHVSVDDKEVNCEVNMYIRSNAEKFRKAAKFLQRSDNEWRTKGIAIDHFDQLLTDSVQIANVTRLLKDEYEVLHSAMSGTTSADTIRNIYQMYGLTKTAKANVDNANIKLRAKKPPIENHMYSLGQYPSSAQAQFDTQQQFLQEAQLLNSLRTMPYSFNVDPEIDSAADVLLRMKHQM